MAANPSGPESQSASQLVLIDQICNCFEDRWRQGQRPTIEEYLALVPESARTGLLRELLALEIAFRSQAQETPKGQVYRERFPKYLDIIEEFLNPKSGEMVSTNAPDDIPAESNQWNIQQDADPDAESEELRHAIHSEMVRDGFTVDYVPLPSQVEVTVKHESTSQGSFHKGTKPGEERDDKYAVRFEVVKKLAQGGLGEVHLARDPAIGRYVALKGIRPEMRRREEMVLRFEEEAQITGQLEHPNVVPIYEIGKLHDGSPFYAMRLLGNRTLRDALKALHELSPQDPNRPLQLNELLRAFISVCQAVAFAHAKKVLHRDLKPANIMLGDFGEVFVLDWGLAKVLEPESESQFRRADSKIPDSRSRNVHVSGRSDVFHSSAGSVYGTPAYMSPEQARGEVETLDARSDIFSLGAILYEILVGKAPYTGKSLTQLLDRAKIGNYLPPRSVNKQIPRALEAICLKALAVAPEDRYSSAAELANEIGRWQAGEPVRAFPEPWYQTGARWMRRHRTLCLASVAAIVTLIAALGIWRWQEGVRLAEIRSTSLPQLLNGQKLLAQGNFEDARLQLTKVHALVASKASLSDLHKRATELLQEAEREISKREARQKDLAQLEQFRRLEEESLFHGSQITGYDLAASVSKSRKAAQQALALYNVELSKPRVPQLTSHLYNPSQKKEIQTACRRLLILYCCALVQHLPGQDEKEIQENVQKALALIKLLDFENQSPHIYALLRSKVSYLKGEVEKGKQELERARKIPVSGATERFVSGWEMFHAHDYEKAQSLFDAALQKDPSRFWPQYFLAMCQIRQLDERPEMAKLAIANLTACLNREPDFIWNYLLRGYAYGKVGDFKAAHADFSEAEQIDSDEYGLYVNRGAVLLLQGKKLEAIQELGHAKRMAPDRIHAYVNLAEIARLDENYEAALGYITDAKEKAPFEALIHRKEAEIHYEKGDLRKALTAYGEAKKCEISGSLAMARIHLQRGRIQHRLNEFELALDEYTSALEIKPHFAEAKAFRGLAHLASAETKKTEEEYETEVDAALRDFEDFLKHSKLDPRLRTLRWLVHRERGVVWYLNGEIQKAMKDFAQASHLSPDPGEMLEYDRHQTAKMHAHQGWAFLTTGKLLAAGAFSKATELNPNLADAYNGLGFALVKMGYWKEGIKNAERALAKMEKDSINDIERPVYFTNAACIYAQASLLVPQQAAAFRAEAIKLVTKAINLIPKPGRDSFIDGPHVLGDPELREPLENYPEFWNAIGRPMPKGKEMP